jgi:hypothetical protein
MLALADGRPAHLTRAHGALLALPEHDQKRLGVIEDWKDGPHQLTYRQVEHTNRLARTALAKPAPDGVPSAVLLRLCTQLIEASIPGPFKDASSSLAADWTDAESWSRPVPADRPGTGTDPEARWGHRNVPGAVVISGREFSLGTEGQVGWLTGHARAPGYLVNADSAAD